MANAKQKNFTIISKWSPLTKKSLGHHHCLKKKTIFPELKDVCEPHEFTLIYCLFKKLKARQTKKTYIYFTDFEMRISTVLYKSEIKTDI